MNIHPIVVHFPIAFLAVYAVCELIRFKRVIDQPHWFYVKAFLVIVGIAGALAAYQAGEAIEHRFAAEYERVIETHAFFAKISIILFGVLAVSYSVACINKIKAVSLPLWSTATRVQEFILGAPAAIVTAVFGLAAISITGALGAVIAHGSDTDPFVSFVYRIFIGQ